MGKKQDSQVIESNPKGKVSIKDQRFKRLNYDPKFKPVPKDMKKVKVDKRFSGMLTNRKFKVITDVDKYGRKQEEPTENKELKEYYQMDMEHQNLEEDQNLQQWMQNYNEQSDTDSELEIEEIINEEEELWSDDDKQVVKGQKVNVTRRLGVCNYDWMNIKLADLMVLFNSFKPTSGLIERIELHQSDFGKERMEEESVKGPANIWRTQQQVKTSDRKTLLKKLLLEGKKDGETDIDFLKLRQYEKQRMRYFYSVVYCDSKQTAQAIYNLCDGKEFENSGTIDLRYVPDDLVFPRQPEEVCQKVSDKKGEVKSKVVRSTGHSHVTLSWEDPDAGTLSSLRKMNWSKLSSQQLKDVDWSLYVQDGLSDAQNKDQESEVESDCEIDQYKANNKKDRVSNNEEEMDIIFSGGFDLAKKVRAKREEEAQQRELSRATKKQKQQIKRGKKGPQRDQEDDSPQPDYEVSAEQKARRREKLELIVNKKQKREFTPDLNDPRFTDVYKNPQLQIDPSSGLFKPQRSGKIFQQVVKRAKNRPQ